MSKMNLRGKLDEESETPSKQTLLLDIPSRLQWTNDNGYCGETAVQSIGMSYMISLDR
jgi:hypothetical protein